MKIKKWKVYVNNMCSYERVFEKAFISKVNANREFNKQCKLYEHDKTFITVLYGNK